MATIYGAPPPKILKKGIISEKPKVYGLIFPIGTTILPTTFTRGYFSKQAGINLAKGNLKQLLSTYPGERVMLPNYGLDLRQFLFEPLDDFLFSEIKDKILNCIGTYLPEIQVVKIKVLALDEIGYSGIPGIQITLSFKLADDDGVPSDITIKVGA